MGPYDIFKYRKITARLPGGSTRAVTVLNVAFQYSKASLRNPFNMRTKTGNTSIVSLRQRLLSVDESRPCTMEERSGRRRPSCTPKAWGIVPHQCRSIPVSRHPYASIQPSWALNGAYFRPSGPPSFRRYTYANANRIFERAELLETPTGLGKAAEGKGEGGRGCVPRSPGVDPIVFGRGPMRKPQLLLSLMGGHEA